MKPERVRGLGLRLGASAFNYRSLRIFGRMLPRLTGGWMPWLQLSRVEQRPLPGRDWVRVRPILSGICGTDMAVLTGRLTDAFSPFGSFPAVLGHEVVGQVVECGDGVDDIGPGQRVVVDPVISCFVRGLEPCAECLDGHPATCLRSADGPISPGLLLGYCHDLPGVWGDEVLAHRSQVYAVPDEVPDEVAVLVEPLSVALHAVLASRPVPDDRVLVVGGGSVGLLVVAALRLLNVERGITVIARRPLQAEMAADLGAEHVVGGEGQAARLAGARAHRTLTGRTAYSGGFGVVYDCVGSAETLDLGMRLTAPRGRLVLVGGPAMVESLDWMPAWVHELRLIGSYVYGAEPSLEGRPHTFDVALSLLGEHPELPLAKLVTHRFPLERWREAMRVNLRRRSAGALKTVFEVSPGSR